MRVVLVCGGMLIGDAMLYTLYFVCGCYAVVVEEGKYGIRRCDTNYVQHSFVST